VSVGKAIFSKQQAIYYTVSNILNATNFMVKSIHTLHSTNLINANHASDN